MKRKGLLKKIIGALCVGALISMPVTVSAAEKEDVVGNWTGSWWASVSLDENGWATDPFNTKPYTMESGSLTVTNINTGNSETVDYDLWRGLARMQDVPDAYYADAVLYKIIEPGKSMVAWNVSKEANETGWKTYGPATITKVTEDQKADTGSNSSARECKHHYEWTVTTEPTGTEDGVSSYMCTSCGDITARQPISANVVIRNNLLASIKNAEAGATVTFNNKAWLCYPQYVLDALKEKGNVSLKTDFTYKGANYSFIIPAGSDYTNLEQADFYGFMYLLDAFDGTIVE
ncbi:MAG: hypothetical protein HDQ97_17410 [Lachnospiraceae bacterium]|nr:hypothetical protein [Lachnospiraceae bacterium]